MNYNMQWHPDTQCHEEVILMCIYNLMCKLKLFIIEGMYEESFPPNIQPPNSFLLQVLTAILSRKKVSGLVVYFRHSLQSIDSCYCDGV